jgi:hypothetical protein
VTGPSHKLRFLSLSSSLKIFFHFSLDISSENLFWGFYFIFILLFPTGYFF